MVHLLMTGFMDGYTRWIIEDDDDEEEEEADGAANDDTGQDEEMTDNGGGEGVGGGGEEAVHGGGEEAGHGGGENMDTSQTLSLLSSIVRDPHVQNLLCKETSTDRAASREEAIWSNWW
jgi:hypothetical protein